MNITVLNQEDLERTYGLIVASKSYEVENLVDGLEPVGYGYSDDYGYMADIYEIAPSAVVVAQYHHMCKYGSTKIVSAEIARKYNEEALKAKSCYGKGDYVRRRELNNVLKQIRIEFAKAVTEETDSGFQPLPF